MLALRNPLANYIISDEDNPDPIRLIKQTLCSANLSWRIGILGLKHAFDVSRKCACSPFFSNDLERRSYDCNEQVQKPEHHNHDTTSKEKCRGQIIRVRRIVHKIRERIGSHDNKYELQGLEDIIKAHRPIIRELITGQLKTIRPSWA